MGVRLLVAGGLLVAFLGGCSSAQQQASSDTMKQVDAACAKVRKLNTQVDALNLDDKTSEALNDPKTIELLQQASDATSELADTINKAASKDAGRIGKLKKSFDENRKLIDDLSEFAADESKDSLQDKARKLRKVADLVGADSCAS